MMQIEKDREDNEEGGENELHTSPIMLAIKELTIAPLQMFILL